MAFYDIDALEADSTSEGILEFLGEQMVRRGKHIFIKCPTHKDVLGKEDNNPSNCVLTDFGCYCFGCGKSLNKIDMTKKITGESFNEVLGIIGDSISDRSNYVLSGKVEKKNTVKILSDKDLELINLSSSVRFDECLFPDSSKEYIQRCGLSPKPDDKSLDADYYIATRHKTISLKWLLINAPEKYNELIKSKAKIAYEKYAKMANDLNDKYSEGAKNILSYFPEENKDEILFDLRRKYKEMYQRAKEIYNEISGIKDDDEIEDIKEDIKPQIPSYDLFG